MKNIILFSLLISVINLSGQQNNHLVITAEGVYNSSNFGCIPGSITFDAGNSTVFPILIDATSSTNTNCLSGPLFPIVINGTGTASSTVTVDCPTSCSGTYCFEITRGECTRQACVFVPRCFDHKGQKQCTELGNNSPGKDEYIGDLPTSQSITANIREESLEGDSESFFDILEIFPNPFADQINLKVNSKTEQMLNINLINSLGQLVYTNQVTVSEGEKLYNIWPNNKQMSNGIYQIRITNSKDIALSKMICYFNFN